MAMAYGGTAKVSDAAKRAMVSDDPKARAEVEEERNQKFDVWDQIGLAADMLPGGAIAAGGAKAALSGGRNIYKMINDSIKGFKAGGDKSAKDAVLNWVSSTDLTILTDAMNYLDGLSGKALDEVEPVRKAINDVYNQFSAPKGGFSLGAKPAGSSDTSTALEYVQDLKAKAKIPKATEEIMATKDLPASTRMNRDMPSPSAASRVSKEGLQDIKDVRNLDDKELLSIYDEMKDAPFPSPDIPLEFSSADEWDAFLRLMKNEIRDRGLF